MSTKSEQQHVIMYGDEHIRFTREPRRLAISRVLIRVHPDCRVVVSAPKSASDEEMLNAVKKRARWIWQQLQTFSKQQEHVFPRCYMSGESHFYLGRRYVLKVVEDDKSVQQVRLWRGKIEVTIRKKSPEKVKELLQVWYRDHAREVFSRRLEILLPQALWMRARPPVRLLAMQTQWGSCSPQGRLTLNPHLVKAPKECIDYVLLHELCHIAEHNHSKRFYRLMNQVMPGWEPVKARLDGMADIFLNDF